MHDLFTELGIKDSDIPVGQSRETLLARAVGDNFFFNRVLKDLVIQYAGETASRLNKLEREAFRNRLIPKVVKPPVVWGIMMPDQTITGVCAICATCGAQVMNWSGDYRKARELKLFDESVPGDIAEVYILQMGAHKINPDVINEKRLQQKWATEDAAKKQNQTLSPEEILVNNQLRINHGKI